MRRLPLSELFPEDWSRRRWRRIESLINMMNSIDQPVASGSNTMAFMFLFSSSDNTAIVRSLFQEWDFMFLRSVVFSMYFHATQIILIHSCSIHWTDLMLARIRRTVYVLLLPGFLFFLRTLVFFFIYNRILFKSCWEVWNNNTNMHRGKLCKSPIITQLQRGT